MTFYKKSLKIWDAVLKKLIDFQSFDHRRKSTDSNPGISKLVDKPTFSDKILRTVSSAKIRSFNRHSSTSRWVDHSDKMSLRLEVLSNKIHRPLPIFSDITVRLGQIQLVKSLRHRQFSDKQVRKHFFSPDPAFNPSTRRHQSDKLTDCRSTKIRRATRHKVSGSPDTSCSTVTGSRTRTRRRRSTDPRRGSSEAGSWTPTSSRGWSSWW